MSHDQPFRLELEFKKQPYCPVCAVALYDDVATVVDDWLVCMQCAFCGYAKVQAYVDARKSPRIQPMCSFCRGITAYTPRKPIARAVPITELVELLALHRVDVCDANNVS